VHAVDAWAGSIFSPDGTTVCGRLNSAKTMWGKNRTFVVVVVDNVIDQRLPFGYVSSAHRLGWLIKV
jgi:hypothetical protein